MYHLPWLISSATSLSRSQPASTSSARCSTPSSRSPTSSASSCPTSTISAILISESMPLSNSEVKSSVTSSSSPALSSSSMVAERVTGSLGMPPSGFISSGYIIRQPWRASSAATSRLVRVSVLSLLPAPGRPCYRCFVSSW